MGVLALAGVLAWAGCEQPGSGSASTAGAGSAEAPRADAAEAALLAELRRFEDERRARADFGAAPPSDGLFGADPYAIRAAGSDRFVGILRGADAIVLLDGELREIARAAAPASPSGLALDGETAFVVGERASLVQPYRVGRDRIEVAPPIPVGAVALRDVAVGPNGVLHLVEESLGRLITLIPDPHVPNSWEQSSVVVGRGAFRVARTQTALIAACLLDHTIVVSRVGADGRPAGAPAVIRNDGPLWSFAASEVQGDLVIASGGVEDKPLDRTHGSFENIDSFLYVDRVEWGAAPRAVRVATVNLSEQGVVVPKALSIARDRGETRITATGYGGEAFASILVREGRGAPEIVTYPLPPGTNAIEHLQDGDMLLANPLLDAWIRYRTEHLPGSTGRVPDPRPGRTAASRLGEALVYTTLIAPWNLAEGPLSRFTCETCHFEGYVDGRTHATGRGTVRATTKPLLGLFNNRPHFSRALDPDLSAVAHNEFRVAGARSGRSPVFDVKVEDRVWFADMGVTASDLTAAGLRRAFMAFLMDWSHRSSALTARRTAFSDEERRGAAVFRDRCEACHQARLASDVPGSRVPFEAWEEKVFSGAAPIVWGRLGYEKTGVEPYVHPEGARVPSLRRLYKKHPYFTNGSAASLGDLLSRARFGERVFFHDGAPPDLELRALSLEERAVLEAFLRLL